VPAVRVNSRSVLVARDSAVAGDCGGLGLYARVSSRGQKADLGRQVARVEAEASGARPMVRRLLAGPLARVVVVEDRDRLGRTQSLPRPPCPLTAVAWWRSARPGPATASCGT
jgi:putative resolvase